MDNYCTVENIIRNCNKIFTTTHFMQFEYGDVVFIAPHYLYYLRLHYGEILPPCQGVTFVTVGFDYPMESFISKNVFQSILESPNLKEWIVDYTFIHHPKLRRVLCLYDDIKTDYKNEFVQCDSVLKIGNIVASNGIPVIRLPYIINNICYVSPPGYLKYNYSSSDDPVARLSKFRIADENIKNSIELLRLPNDLKKYNMTNETAREILTVIKNHIQTLGIRFRAIPWNGEIYYTSLLDKDKMFNG